MYIPRQYKLENLDQVRDLISQHGFAQLVSTAPDGTPIATHIPLMLIRNVQGTEVLTGHMARSNEQWRGFEARPKVLAIFQGPHTYVSSSWYAKENVSTWNYLAVHITGTVAQIEGRKLLDSLKLLTDKYEQHEKQPRWYDSLSPDMINREIRGLVAFEISIDKIEAVAKLSQNRNPEDFQNIIRKLEERGDEQSSGIAEAMKKNQT